MPEEVKNYILRTKKPSENSSWHLEWEKFQRCLQYHNLVALFRSGDVRDSITSNVSNSSQGEINECQSFSHYISTIPMTVYNGKQILEIKQTENETKIIIKWNKINSQHKHVYFGISQGRSQQQQP